MLKISNLVEGEFLSSTTYMKVLKKTPNEILVEDMNNGQQFSIEGDRLIESLDSAAQYSESIKCSKHELVEHLQGAKDKIFTVCFTKQNGDERILTGHLLSFEKHLGRTNVRDLNIPLADATQGKRQVDNRELKWLVLDGKKYISQYK